MIPIRDTIRASRVPIVNFGLLAANIVAFYYTVMIERSGSERDFIIWLHQWAVVPRELFRDPGPAELIPFFTAMFLHGGLLHLLGNMLFLWIFGDNVEDRLGHLGYLAFYLFCGFCSFACQIAVAKQSALPMLGASGAIAGVIGAYVVLFPRARVLTLVPIFIFAYFVELPAYVFIFIWLVFQNIAPAVLAPPGVTETGGVAHWAHIGGFVVGALIAWMFRVSLGRGRAERRARPQVLVDWEDWSRRRRSRDWYRSWRR